MGAPNKRTVEAPNGATSREWLGKSVIIAKQLIAINPPIKEWHDCHLFKLGCIDCLALISFLLNLNNKDKRLFIYVELLDIEYMRLCFCR